MGLIAGVTLACIAAAAIALTRPAPARFEVSDLVIDPSEVEAGKPAEISVKVKNVGEAAGTYTAVLRVDGRVEATKDIALAGGATQTVSFTITRDVVGTCGVEVDGLGGDLKVYFELADAVGDVEYFFDITGITLVREEDGLILIMEASRDIPTLGGLDSGVYCFFFDVDNDHSADFEVFGLYRGPLHISLLDRQEMDLMELTYEHLGRALKIKIPLAEMGSPESFNFRAEVYVVGRGRSFPIPPRTLDGPKYASPNLRKGRTVKRKLSAELRKNRAVRSTGRNRA